MVINSDETITLTKEEYIDLLIYLEWLELDRIQWVYNE
jgi:hypothetical protein